MNSVNHIFPRQRQRKCVSSDADQFVNQTRTRIKSRAINLGEEDQAKDSLSALCARIVFLLLLLFWRITRFAPSLACKVGLHANIWPCRQHLGLDGTQSHQFLVANQDCAGCPDLQSSSSRSRSVALDTSWQSESRCCSFLNSAILSLGSAGMAKSRRTPGGCSESPVTVQRPRSTPVICLVEKNVQMSAVKASCLKLVLR